MIELLMQPLDGGAAVALGHWPQPSADAAGAAMGWVTAAAKAEEAPAAGADDAAYFDQFFEPLQSIIPALVTPVTEEALFDSGTEDYLRTLLSEADGFAMELGLEQQQQQQQQQPFPGEAASSGSPADDDATLSPASFDGLTSPMTVTPAPSVVSMMTSPAVASTPIMILAAPASPAPSSRSVASSSRSSESFGSGISSGRVDKKKEANREAAYRYRMKQRLGDTATDLRRAELQARADQLAGGVDRAEEEARFLIQMCRQIFFSRKQLLLSGSGPSRD